MGSPILSLNRKLPLFFGWLSESALFSRARRWDFCPLFGASLLLAPPTSSMLTSHPMISQCSRLAWDFPTLCLS
jgi:hypothetical protein